MLPMNEREILLTSGYYSSLTQKSERITAFPLLFSLFPSPSPTQALGERG
nr:hypothetical protein Q903MT_gene5277 [Picea sitchensis]